MSGQAWIGLVCALGGIALGAITIYLIVLFGVRSAIARGLGW